jgi:phage-related protein
MIAPALAVAATISIIQPLAGTAGKKFLVDAILFENASYVGEYFDNVTQSYENTQVNLGLTPLPIPHITGMKLNADIAIGDLILNTIDENGVVWVCTDIEGWWVHPEPEVRDIPRGWGDGSYDVRGRYQARQLTLNGVFLTPDPSLVQVSRDKLIKETDLVYVGAWIKVDEEPTKASYVRLSGRPDIKTINARGRTEFSIGLRAPDPLKYEWYAEDELGYRFVTIQGANSGVAGSGAGTVTNTGNAYAPVILQITGPLTGPATILNQTTNESITIIETLTSGQILEIDTRDHVVTLNGDAVGKRSLVDVLTDWTLLAPGDNSFSFVDAGTATSTASLAVYYRSAWLG